MKDLQQLWIKVLSKIEENVTPVSYSTWFPHLSLKEIDEVLNIAYLESTDSFATNILNSRYLELIGAGFESVTNKKYRIVIKDSNDFEEATHTEEVIEAPKKLATADIIKQKIFNPKYTFDNFVVGDNNVYAHAASLAVAESPSRTFNPLFIYGGSGLGKTHLMNAIGIYLLEHNDDINVLYVSSEMFTNEMIKAISDNKMNEFKNKYRKVDVLLIDDIQFLENKTTIQEEFFHTFNTLYDLNKQIVISSDRAPNKLVHLEERLRSRFMINMIADLQPAEYETRVAILMKKAQNSGIEMDDDLYEVICLIAEKIKDNIRELEGAFNRIVSFSALMNENIDKTFAKRILKDIIQNNSTSPTPEKIKTIVSRYFHIKVSDMESSKRTNNIAYPRQIAMYLCREMTDYSLSKIGNLFGGRHYTTVMHASDKIQDELKSDDSLKDIISTLKKDISE